MALREPSSAAATQTVVQRAAAPFMLSFSWSMACLIQTPVSSDELPASHVGAGRYQRAPRCHWKVFSNFAEHFCDNLLKR